MNQSEKLIDAIAADAAYFTAMRRDIHAHPELCYEEERTSALVADALGSWGIPVVRGLAKTGIVGIISNGVGDRAIGLRADMDALPLLEKSGVAHASVYPGKMHACGHDGHTTMLLAAAKHLAENHDFDGTVYLIFQPAEEGGGGALAMMRDGLFERFPMQAIFALHNWPGIDTGKFALRPGPVQASSNSFRIVVHGKGGHAAMPHHAVDPVPIACQLIQAFQTIISRNMRPIDAGVISVTILQGGSATNVIPDTCVLEGTVRTFDVSVLDMIESRMRQLTEGICNSFGAHHEFSLTRKYPPTINHPGVTSFVKRVLLDFVGDASILDFEPTMGAEDFSFFLQQVPGCYIYVGNGGDADAEVEDAGPCMLHNPRYDFNDALIPLGASLWVRLVRDWFAEQAVDAAEPPAP